MSKAGTEPVRLSGEVGPGEAGLGVRVAARMDNSKCMERLSTESAGVQKAPYQCPWFLKRRLTYFHSTNIESAPIVGKLCAGISGQCSSLGEVPGLPSSTSEPEGRRDLHSSG